MGISLILIKSDSKKVGNRKVSPIHIKYSYKGSYKRFPTHIFIEQKYWKSGSISSRCTDYVNINRRISTLISQIQNIITDITEDGQIPTPNMVKGMFERKTEITIKKQPKSKGFWKSYEEFLIDKSKFHRGYTKTLLTLKLRLKDFENTTKQKITYDYILFGRFEREFKNYCWDMELPNQTNNRKKIIGLSNNYINKLFSHLTIFLNWSIGERYIKEIRRFKKLKIIRNDVLVYLNSDEVKHMYDYKDYDYPNTYQNSVTVKDYDKKGNLILRNNKELIKDIFSFQCSVGCRWGDIHKMTVGMFKIQKGFFIWTMEKTKNIVIVPENPISLGIFMKYSKGKSVDQLLFPKYSQQKFNLHLKEIGKELKFNRLVKRELMVGTDIREDTKKDKYNWELLSSHCGRRSFVKNLLDLGTMDNWSIMKLSGHKSIDSFQKYVSVNIDDISKGKELYTSDIDRKDVEDIKKMLDKLPKKELLSLLMERMK